MSRPPPPFISCVKRQERKKEDAFLVQVRLTVCHGMHCVGTPRGMGEWIEMSHIRHDTLETALYFACSNMNNRRLPRRRRRLPPELLEMVSAYLVEPVYVAMANEAAMAHLGHIPTGLPPFLDVRLPVISMRNLAHVELSPEELANACVQTTPFAADANLTLNFLTKNAAAHQQQQQHTLYYKFLSSSGFHKEQDKQLFLPF